MNDALTNLRTAVGVGARSESQGAERAWVIVAIWALAYLTFSIPGRIAPDSAESLDIVGLVKFVCRFGAFVSGVLLLSRYIGTSKARPELKAFAGLVPFLLWAGFSTTWSPVISISVGQLLGMYAQIVLAVLVAVISRNVEVSKRVLGHVVLALTLVSALLMIVHLRTPGMSTFDRDSWAKTDNGILHPTSAGGNASLGFVLLLYLQMTGALAGKQLYFIVGILMHSSVLLCANSRTALAMALLASAVIVVSLGSRRLFVCLLLMVAFLVPLYVALDPGFSGIAKSLNKSTEYVSRGQTSGQLAAGSGRQELWSVLAAEYTRSPLIGHGYYMTSTTGYVYVWRQHGMLDAHNLWLQVLFSLGAIGFLLFLAGGFRLIHPIFRLRHGTAFQKQRYLLFAVTAIWFLGWGIGCSTFMSSIRPESVAFFSIIGLCVGALYSEEGSVASASSLESRTSR